MRAGFELQQEPSENEETLAFRLFRGDALQRVTK